MNCLFKTIPRLKNQVQNGFWLAPNFQPLVLDAGVKVIISPWMRFSEKMKFQFHPGWTRFHPGWDFEHPGWVFEERWKSPWMKNFTLDEDDRKSKFSKFTLDEKFHPGWNTGTPKPPKSLNFGQIYPTKNGTGARRSVPGTTKLLSRLPCLSPRCQVELSNPTRFTADQGSALLELWRARE